MQGAAATQKAAIEWMISYQLAKLMTSFGAMIMRECALYEMHLLFSRNEKEWQQHDCMTLCSTSACYLRLTMDGKQKIWGDFALNCVYTLPFLFAHT